MKRRSRRSLQKSPYSNQIQKRDILDIARRPRLFKKVQSSSIITDNRLHRPIQQQKRDRFIRKIALLNLNQPSSKAHLKSSQGPSRAFTHDIQQLRRETCQSRHKRKEVLFALKKAGKGGSKKQHKTTWKSGIKC